MKEELLEEIWKLMNYHGKVVGFESNAMSIWFDTEDGKTYWLNIGEVQS